MISHFIYDILIGELRQTKEDLIDNGFLSFLWIYDNGQSIIDYLYSSILKKRDTAIRSVQLEMDIFLKITPGKDYTFPMISMHIILVFERFAELTMKLDISSFHSFIHQSVHYRNGMMIQTNFGIIVDECSCDMKERIYSSSQLRSVNKLISFIDGGSCQIISNCTTVIIQCSMRPISVQSFSSRMKVVYTPNEDFDQRIKDALVDKFGESKALSLNYSTFIFNTSYMNKMSVIGLKANLIYSSIYHSLLLLSRTKEQFMATDFVKHRIFTMDQNEVFIHQIDESIEFQLVMLIESERINNSLNAMVDDIYLQNERLNILSNSLLFSFAHSEIEKLSVSKVFVDSKKPKPRYIAPQRTEKAKIFETHDLEAKMQLIITNIMQCELQTDSVILQLKTKKISYLSRPLSFLLSILPKFWRQLLISYPLFKKARITVEYYPGLTHLKVPILMLQTWIRIILAQGLRDNSDVAMLNLKCIDVYCELSVQTKDEFTLERVKAAEESTKKEYYRRNLEVPSVFKWPFRPFALFLSVHTLNGYSGFQRVIDAKNKSAIQRSFFCRWPVDTLNPGFNFTEWRRQHPNEQFQTKEAYF